MPQDPRQDAPAPFLFNSVIESPLERLRAMVNDALSTSNQPAILARSRTGQLYPSTLGNASDSMRALARGAGGELINQLENATSPAGIGIGLSSPALHQAVASGIDMTAPRVASGLGTVGRGVERLGLASRKPLGYTGLFELLADRSPIRGVLAAATPYVATGAGRVMQAIAPIVGSLESVESKLSRLRALYNAAPEADRHLIQRAIDRLSGPVKP